MTKSKSEYLNMFLKNIMVEYEKNIEIHEG